MAIIGTKDQGRHLVIGGGQPVGRLAILKGFDGKRLEIRQSV